MAPEGSTRKFTAQKQLAEVMAHRTHIDSSIEHIEKLIFGTEKAEVRPSEGQPVVDDWSCLKSLVRYFQSYIIIRIKLGKSLAVFQIQLKYKCHERISCIWT